MRLVSQEPRCLRTPGTPTAARQIVVDTGNGQSGVVGQTLPLPFIAIVTDAGFNRLSNVAVTFTVKQGGGSIGGNTTFSTQSDADGRVAAVLKLGQQEGFDNNVVEVTFPGNPGQPAAFLASAKVPGNPAQTSVTGIVLDNSNQPIEGVTMRMFRTHQNTGLPEEVVTAVETDALGFFNILPAPVGSFKLMADGATALNGPWPTLEFDIVTVAGRATDVGLPIYLPKLDGLTTLCVDETTGGTLTLPAVPGFALTVAAGSATFAGGARSGCLTVTPVNADKVPMSPGFGQQPRFVVTIQPVGTVFNPPAQLTLPNVDGLAPRAVTEMYSYDHDLASFVAIGTGTVSEDGSVIVSDPGVGVIKAGWHCGGNPNTVGSAGTCPTCKKCQGTDCVVDNSLQPPNVCERCSNGSPVDRTNGSTPADANSCCFNGSPVDKARTVMLEGFPALADLASCPNRVAAPWSFSYDGCSLPDTIPGAVRNNPALGFSTLFSDDHFGATATHTFACDAHDRCYQSCSGGADMAASQETCDLTLRNIALSTCADSLLDPRDVLSGAASRCFVFAVGYYEVLSPTFINAGQEAYATRQRQVCQCCQ